MLPIIGPGGVLMHIASLDIERGKLFLHVILRQIPLGSVFALPTPPLVLSDAVEMLYRKLLWLKCRVVLNQFTGNRVSLLACLSSFTSRPSRPS